MAQRTRLLIPEAPLLLLPTLAVRLGLNEAIVVHQLHYWLCKPTAHVRDGRRWVYNSYADWEKQFPFWSVPTIKRIFLSLERQGIVMSRQFEKGGWNRRKWYSIEYEPLASLLGQGSSASSDSPPRGDQPAPIDECRLSPSTGAICAPLDAESSTYSTPDNSSSTAASPAADRTDDPSPQDRSANSAQPGELHPDVVALVQSMVTTAFHCLALPTTLNEHFWDAQIDLIHTQSRLSLAEIIRDVDAYYASHPQKIPATHKAAMASMAYGIKFALDRAQRRRRR